MKQVLQDLKSGTTDVVEVPPPTVKTGHVLIRTRCSVLSAGTERMLVDFGRAGWIQKALKQPEKVQQVLEKIRTDGLFSTVEAVRSKLDQPMPMGYCNVGEVVEVGKGVTGLTVGDRVVSNGRHAEIVVVPQNLCAKVPEPVADEAAVFTVLGSIALQGIRLTKPTLGETVAVIGLGLIGLIAVQLLRANGCRVIGSDFDARKLELARSFGAHTVDLSRGEDPVQTVSALTQGRGADAVLITASTSSNEPVRQAASMSRKRGRIVLVGVAGLELSRADFYEKELTFQVSCSYGPGRYDPEYEEKGRDYPLGLVRWTEQRNFEAVLDMLADRRVDFLPLISHRFAIAEAAQAYELIARSADSLGILLRYPLSRPLREVLGRSVQITPRSDPQAQTPVVGVIGAGNYAGAILMPAFAASGAHLHTIASATGVSGVHLGRKYGFERTTTVADAVFADVDINVAVIATRHDTHAQYVLSAQATGKHVFVEKPLCLTLDELAAIEAAFSGSSALLMVGFNRRFSPHVMKMKSLLESAPGPKSFIMTVNAGALPVSHWAHDIETGGGRIVGECCHFIDLVRFLADQPIESHRLISMESATHDTATINLTFRDGSIATIHYFANGSKGFPKERLEVFASGRVLQLDNFRNLKAFGWPGFSSTKRWRQDKGQRACVQAFINAVREGRDSPIPIRDILEVSRISIELQQACNG